MVLMGFKSDWRRSLSFSTEYLNTIYCAFDQKLSFAILRVKDGFDYSSAIAQETSVIKEVPVNEDDDDDDKPTGKWTGVRNGRAKRARETGARNGRAK